MALALSVALEVTGPARSLLFSLRLPVAVLVFGAIWAEVRWRWGGDSSRQSVPMATPCLIVSATAGVAAVTARLVAISPLLACVVLGVASAGCCGVACLLIADGREDSAAGADGEYDRITGFPRAAAAP